MILRFFHTHFFVIRCVWRCTVRTNIVLDKQLVAQGLKLTKLKTRRSLVDYALRELVRRKQQRKIMDLRGQVEWEGNLDEMRRGRGFSS
jgi:Arc/MetJ family transcription regulator